MALSIKRCVLQLICFYYLLLPLVSPADAATQQGATASVDLEPINGTINFRFYGKNGKDDKPWFDGRGLDMRHIQCVRRGRCEKLTFNTCLDAKIPYTHTSLDLNDYQRQSQVLERLENYRALQHVPKCWAVIQPLLCAVFAPKCEQINGQDMVYLPSLEMCRLTLEPCRILYNSSYFPAFLRCNETLFPPKCMNDVREMKFNLTGRCLDPLVVVDAAPRFYEGIDGCGLRCKDPLYTDDEHRQIEKLVAWGGTICFVANLFVVATFIIDWENANKYPALIVFYINLCYLIAGLGWLVQFTPGSREDIVCRKDGTLRHSEPAAGENLSCIVVFVLIYYFLTAAMVWFVFLTYAWHLRAVGNAHDRIDKKGSYFHLVAWSLPLVLTITTLALSEVDANSTVGFCFVGYLNHAVRGALLLGPLMGVILVGGYFIVRGMIRLFDLKHFASKMKSSSTSNMKYSNKIHLLIVRMGLCAFLTSIFIFVAIACHMQEFKNSEAWAQSLKNFIICKISSTHTDKQINCKLESRPNVAILQLHLLCLFGAGIVMSTWCWTPSSIESWKRYFKKKCGKDVVEEVKMPKHKVIAHTWAKRKKFEKDGHLSITLCNTYTDPVGLNFDVNDLNSSETNEISSTWANYLPQFVKRRMAITGAANTNSSSQGPRKNSFDSEVSFSVRHVSVESRRNSVDSQVSVKIAEMKTKVAARSRNHHHQYDRHSNAPGKRTHRRRDFIQAASTSRRKYNGRRESSTSMESQVIAVKKTTYPNASQNVGLFARSTKKHNFSSTHNGLGAGATTFTKSGNKRRSAIAGFDPAVITEFLAKNGELILPFLQQQDMSSSSEEETSHASFLQQDAQLVGRIEQEESMSDSGNLADEKIGQAALVANDDRKQKQAALECLLKSMMQKSGDSHNRSSRNTQRSRQSGRKAHTGNSISTSGRRSKQRSANSYRSQNKKCNCNGALPVADAYTHSKKQEKDPSDGHAQTANDENSLSSFSSMDLGVPLGMLLHSSYSGMSTEKPHSRNSKTSCDVGIQANAYEIAHQTLISCDDAELQLAMRHLNTNNRTHDEYAEDMTELQTLLFSSRKQQPQIVNGSSKQHDSLLSEAEKLKMLLLPSK